MIIKQYVLPMNTDTTVYVVSLVLPLKQNTLGLFQQTALPENKAFLIRCFKCPAFP